MSVIEKQENEDKVFYAEDRQFAGKLTEALRINGQTGKVTASTAFASGAQLTEDWDKPAADGSAAATFAEHIFFRAPQQLQVMSVNYLPDAALTASDTNYATILIQRRNADGTGLVTVASINSALTVAPFSGNWAQWVAVALTLTQANLVLAVGQTLTFSILKVGTGVVVPAGRLAVAYKLL